MSGGIHLISNDISGYRFFSCSGVSGRAVAASSYAHCDLKSFTQIRILSMKCSFHTFKAGSFACNASSGGHRRNSDFSRQNKHGFSRSWNRQNQERESSENLEESELLSSKNGPLLSLSSSPRFQATATPGSREKEIVELFRKVQAQLRERAAIKEGKNETSQGQSRKSETVDSLLRLLKKHSAEQGKRRSGSGSKDFVTDQPEDEEQNTSFFNSTSSLRDEAQEYIIPSSTRPESNFQRKSPIPRMKYQPIYSTKDSTELVSNSKLQSKKKKSTIETQPESEPVPVSEPGPEPEPVFLDGHKEVYDEIPESESSDTDEAYDAEFAEKQSTEEPDLSALKLSELRVLAKSRGLKGYSKLKKGQLVELLCRGSI